MMLPVACAAHAMAEDNTKANDQFFDFEGVKIRYQVLGEDESRRSSARLLQDRCEFKTVVRASLS